MKKFLKGLVIVLAIIASIYFIPRIIMWNRIAKLPDTAPAELITDFTLTEEKTYEISEGDISIRIPSYYASSNVREYYSIVADAHLKNRQLIIYYKPMDTIIKALGTGSGDYNQYVTALQYFNDNKPGYPINLFFNVPDDVFELIKCVSLADKSDYNFWNLSGALELEYYLRGRQKMDEAGNLRALYERDNVRALITETPDSPGTYAVLIISKQNAEKLYGFVIDTPAFNDITKLLNTFEYTTGF